MSLDLSSYKVASLSTGDSTKLNNGYDAIQNFVNALPIANLAGYPADATKFLRGDGQWVSGCKVTTSTWAGGPPGSPGDTDIWIATAVDGNGTRWAFQYNAGSAGPKWEFIGGGPMYNNVDALEATASGAATDLATVGPTVALVRAGDFVFTFGATVSTNAAGTANATVGLLQIGAGILNNISGNSGSVGSTGFQQAISRVFRASFAAGQSVKLQYSSSNATSWNFGSRFIAVVPVRIT